MATTSATKVPTTASRDRIFADVGPVPPEERFTRMNLLRHLHQAIKRQRLSPFSAAARMGIDQARMAELMNGRVGRFSSDQMIWMLIRLGQDVEIRIKPKARGRARGRRRLLSEGRA